MGRLSEYVAKNSKYLALDDGESFTGKFKGYEMEVNEKGEQVPCYKFEDEFKTSKSLTTQSKVLAKFFDEDDGKAKLGAIVKITREGKGNKTRYAVELIKQGEDEDLSF